jgi:hypothetical protein
MREVVDGIVRETYEGLVIRGSGSRRRCRKFGAAGGLPARDFHAMMSATAAMPDHLATDTLDAELLPGARNAIRDCLRVKPEERVTIITDAGHAGDRGRVGRARSSAWARKAPSSCSRTTRRVR